MPELPEVEWVRRGLEDAALTAPIERVYRSRKPLRTGAHWRDERLRSLVGFRPGAVSRRGKHIIWTMERGGASTRALLVHLGMTGQLEVLPSPEPRPAHTHVELFLSDGRVVRYIDVRRFGGMRAAPLDHLWSTSPLCDLGPEPLGAGFDGSVLAENARGRTRALWPLLLDQGFVAGVGNIYALEALFRAGLHPLTPAHRLRPAAWGRLAAAIRAVLEEGLRNGGTTLQDYRRVDGTPGENAEALAIYGRVGERCRCGARIRAVAMTGRNGAYCPRDQPRTRGRVD